MQRISMAKLYYICIIYFISYNEGSAPPAASYNHNEAVALLRRHRVSIYSSGNCSNRNNRQCTSLEGIKQKAIRDVVALKNASKCQIVVTGGTETGHNSASGHSQGWKLDVRMNDCLRTFAQRNLTSVGRGYFCSPSGNLYYDEKNHFDINFGQTRCKKNPRTQTSSNRSATVM